MARVTESSASNVRLSSLWPKVNRWIFGKSGVRWRVQPHSSVNAV